MAHVDANISVLIFAMFLSVQRSSLCKNFKIYDMYIV